MSLLLMAFLVAALANTAILQAWLDPAFGAPAPAWPRLAMAAVLPLIAIAQLLLVPSATWPTAWIYLRILAFILVAVAIEPPGTRLVLATPAERCWRGLLPLAGGMMAVIGLVVGGDSSSLGWRSSFLTCATAAGACLLIWGLAPAFRERLVVSPMPLHGAPLALASAALLALGAMGFALALPW